MRNQAVLSFLRYMQILRDAEEFATAHWRALDRLAPSRGPDYRRYVNDIKTRLGKSSDKVSRFDVVNDLFCDIQRIEGIVYNLKRIQYDFSTYPVSEDDGNIQDTLCRFVSDIDARERM